MKLNLNIEPELETIAADIKENGGKIYAVGGVLVDYFQGKELKDLDLEVHGLSLSQLQRIILKYGEPKITGQSFAVVRTNIDKIEYEFSIPCLENSGLANDAVDLDLVPRVTLEQAASRRDLTINSMYVDLETMEFYDLFNGKKDLENGILRHVDDNTFVTQPIRVLRVMQLLARKAKTVAPETVRICSSISDKYDTLFPECVFDEWTKLLMKGTKPSLGLNFLVDCGWIMHYPELRDLIGISQEPEYHPEGDVWTHTLMTIDAAAQLKEHLPDGWKTAYMYAMLLHDVGKAATEKKGIISGLHIHEGIPLAENFMKRFKKNTDIRDLVCKIIKDHMTPFSLMRDDAKPSSWARLHNRVPLNIVGNVVKADHMGKGHSITEECAAAQKAFELFEKYNRTEIPKVLRGQDLITAGYKPGESFKEMLDYSFGIQMDEKIEDKAILLKRVQEKYK